MPSPSTIPPPPHNARKRPVRSLTLRLPRTKSGMARLRLIQGGFANRELPRTRGECVDGPRPCPYVSCRQNLYLDTSEKTGSLKLNFPDLEPHEMTESCALDVADRGGVRLEDIGELINVTRERARQIEIQALAKFKENGGAVLIALAEDDDG